MNGRECVITCPMEYPLLYDTYLCAADPEVAERALSWDVAMGLQAVDGLVVSEYLREMAGEHIEGRIGMDEVQQRLNSYYVEHGAGAFSYDEADKVAANIAELLHEPAFHFSPAGLASIHKRLFHNVFKFAGKIRDYNITKREWVLDGDTVHYAHASEIIMALDYDMEKEKSFSFQGLSQDKVMEHLARFIAGIWQVHPFPEGNTRSVAVFCIKYLRYLGYQVNNRPFATHAKYFRDALVRANYNNMPKGVEEDCSFLIRFFRNLLLGETHVLHSRDLHINAAPTGQAGSQEQDKCRISSGQVELPTKNICQLVDVLGAGQLSVKEMMSGMKLRGRDNFLNHYLTPALAGGYVSMLYPDSPRHPRQKYRLTPRGCLVWDKLHA